MRENTEANDESDALAEDAAYENAFSMVPGMGEAAPVAAHTLEVLEDMNANSAPDAQIDDTLERERALALQKGQAPQHMATPRPLPH
jgi:hypothetical protein